MAPLYRRVLKTKLGDMVCLTDSSSVHLLEFRDRPDFDRQIAKLLQLSNGQIEDTDCELHQQLESELADYFNGNRIVFAIPLSIAGTQFQRSVWAELAKIEYGETRSYLEIAQNLGNPNSCRAVGKANGDNRLAILLPCHRVIASNSSLTGYAGGIHRKQWLLDHERYTIGENTS